jgi:two-component system copper resistance phosphate regulon response regulator CusR
MRILYVEDDLAACEFVTEGLGRRGVLVETVHTSREGFAHATAHDYDVIILDVILPDGEGFDLLKSLRQHEVFIPTIYLSARGEVADRLRGFQAGADDYLRKPFAIAELMARVRAVARRRAADPCDILRVADLTMDLRSRKVIRGGRTIHLPPKQFALLELLLRRRGEVVGRQQLMEQMHGSEPAPRSNIVNVQMCGLRKQIDGDLPVHLIHTVYGVGYTLEPRSVRSEADWKVGHA